MHVLLTDQMTCPRCGPTFGLVLLAHEVRERRVLEGELGCPNCRDHFPVRAGFADLRAPPRTALPTDTSPPAPPEPAATLRLAALLGIVEGPGAAVLIGDAVSHAAGLARSVPGIEWVAVNPACALESERSGVTRIAARPGLPFYQRRLRGAVVDARIGDSWIVEAARVVAPLGRVVVLHTNERTSDLLRREGLSLLAVEAETVVAARG